MCVCQGCVLCVFTCGSDDRLDISMLEQSIHTLFFAHVEYYTFFYQMMHLRPIKDNLYTMMRNDDRIVYTI